MNKQKLPHNNPCDPKCVLWFDPACAKLNPDDALSPWVCSLRGGNGGVVAWVEGESQEQVTSRCAAIVKASNGHAALLGVCERLASWDGNANNLSYSVRVELVRQAKEAIEEVNGTA